MNPMRPSRRGHAGRCVFPVFVLLVLGCTLAMDALAQGVPTYGACDVLYYDGANVPADLRGKRFAAPRFTVLEDAQDEVFKPDNRYTEDVARRYPDSITRNVDQFRNNGAAWNSDDVQSQFHRFAGGEESFLVRDYSCFQFLTAEAADRYIARVGAESTRFSSWAPTGPHVVAGKTRKPPPKTVVAPKPPKPKPPSSGGALVVEPAKPTVAPDWNEKVHEQLRKEAQQKIDAAAKTAQADKQKQAEIQKFFEERRRQGRSQ